MDRGEAGGPGQGDADHRRRGSGRKVSTRHSYVWTKGEVEERLLPATTVETSHRRADEPERKKVVAFDYGIKHNILRRLVSSGLRRDGGPGADNGERMCWP